MGVEGGSWLAVPNLLFAAVAPPVDEKLLRSEKSFCLFGSNLLRAATVRLVDCSLLWLCWFWVLALFNFALSKKEGFLDGFGKSRSLWGSFWVVSFSFFPCWFTAQEGFELGSVGGLLNLFSFPAIEFSETGDDLSLSSCNFLFQAGILSSAGVEPFWSDSAFRKPAGLSLLLKEEDFATPVLFNQGLFPTLASGFFGSQVFFEAVTEEMVLFPGVFEAFWPQREEVFFWAALFWRNDGLGAVVELLEVSLPPGFHLPAWKFKRALLRQM